MYTKIISPNRRRNLLTKNFRRSQKYSYFICKRCEENNIPGRIEKIAKEVKTKAKKISPRVRKSLKQIDNFITKMLKKYEIGGKTPYHIPWSPTIHQLNAEANLMKLYWRYCTKPSEKLKRKLVKKSTESFMFDDNKPKFWFRQKYNAKIIDLREARAAAIKLREDFYNDEIDAALLYQDTSREKMLTQILKYEEQNSTFTNLNWVLQKPSLKNYHVDIPDEEGWKTVTEERDVTASLRKEFNDPFTQTNTPFVTSGNDAALQTMIVEEPFDEWESIIQNLRWVFSKKIDILEYNPDTVDCDEIITGFRIWYEKKSTSPSRRSLSLYKILNQPNSDEEE